MMKKNQKTSFSSERGEVMIEGMVVMIITMFILIWILGLGFLYYQRYVTTIVTNDAAVKIAATFNNPTSDIIMGYVTTEDVSSRNLYRGILKNEAKSNVDINEDRAEAYIKYKLDTANFAGTVKDVDVTLVLVSDSVLRKHVKLTTVCEYNTPFGEIFGMFGMTRTAKYSVTASADYTDIADYISTINFAKRVTSGDVLGKAGVVKSLISTLNALVNIFNR